MIFHLPLIRIHGIIVQLATELGASVAATPLAGVR
jgi:hypothetical protein